MLVVIEGERLGERRRANLSSSSMHAHREILHKNWPKSRFAQMVVNRSVSPSTLILSRSWSTQDVFFSLSFLSSSTSALASSSSSPCGSAAQEWEWKILLLEGVSAVPTEHFHLYSPSLSFPPLMEQASERTPRARSNMSEWGCDFMHCVPPQRLALNVKW